MNSSFTLGILGAGFSGKMLASKLLLNSEFANNSKIYLIDSNFVNGVAYGTPDQGHLLNVRASNMSAYSEKPSHFVDFLIHNYSDQNWPNKFASRKIYSEYLNSIFAASLEVNSKAIEKISGAVNGISRKGDKIEVQLNKQTLVVDHLVLAYGNIHVDSIPTSNGFAKAKAAWPFDKDSLSKNQILLVGTSLTMVDLALSAAKLNPNSKLVAVSRNGLLPQVHKMLNADQISEIKLILGKRFENQNVGLLALLSFLHKLTKKYPWREVVDALRPRTISIWKGFSSKDKQIFNRRLSTFWSIHRHRVSPEVNDQLQKLITDGRLEIVPGKILNASESAAKHKIVIQKRGGEKLSLTVEAVINCTGPASLKQLSSIPMISTLLSEKLIRADELGVGLSMANSEDDQVLFTKQISSLGPPLRGEFLECTSVPELRGQVERLAELLQRHTGH